MRKTEREKEREKKRKKERKKERKKTPTSLARTVPPNYDAPYLNNRERSEW